MADTDYVTRPVRERDAFAWVDPEPVKARLVNVFTSPLHRRRGLARRLVSETMQAVRERGVRSVTLASTDSAAGLYRSLGFEVRPGEFRILLP
jgi:ribosomal protein S18 acetylase RimI-like enzyme